MPCLPMCALGSTTHTGRDGIECCDLCGYPVHSAPDERDRLKAELRAAEAACAALRTLLTKCHEFAVGVSIGGPGCEFWEQVRGNLCDELDASAAADATGRREADIR